MISLRNFSILVLAVVLVSTAAAQSNSGEMTAEESYLQETMELMIIRETARSSSREQKMIALEYIADALDRGSKNDEIRQTLEFLTSEGRKIQARESGRLANNFPDIRWKAARYLGQMGTEEARQSLLGICRYYRNEEPVVIMEAIASLGNIAVNEDNDTIATVIWAARHYHDTNPSDGIALAVIHAFDQIAKKYNGINYPEAIQLLNSISAFDRPYSTAVKERARQLLADLRSYGSGSGESASQK